MTTENKEVLQEVEVNEQLEELQGKTPVESTETNDVLENQDVSGEDEGDEGETNSDDIKSAPKRRGRPPKKEEVGLGLGIFKLNEFTQEPEYGTTHSACFDIRVNLKGVYTEGQVNNIKTITRTNQSVVRRIEVDNDGRLYISLPPNERMLAPTGAIFDIPVGYSLKVHPRSGTSYKQGINLINQEGVIDADYVEELFLPLVNSSENHVKIYDGERYAQGELQEVIQARFDVLEKRPKHKSERVGGFGHTGVK